MKSENEVAQLCLTLSDPMDCSLPGSSIHGIFQPRVLEWDATAFSGKPYTPCQLPAKGKCHRDRGKVTKHKHPNGTESVSQFSRSVVSDSLRPHEPQHARPPCPSPTPGVHPNSCPLSRDRVTQWQNSQGSNSSPGRITATQAHCHTDKAQGQAKKCPHRTSLAVQWLGLRLPVQAAQI